MSGPSGLAWFLFIDDHITGCCSFILQQPEKTVFPALILYGFKVDGAVLA